MGVYRGVTTSELDELAAETAAAMTSMHPDYALVSLATIVRPRSTRAGPPDTPIFLIAAGSQDRSL